MSVKLLIIGGVAGGATAAARARRLDETAQIILFERGEYISFANCGLPYYIGEVIKDREKLLVTTPKGLKDRYNLDIRTCSEVMSIDVKRKLVEVKDLKTGDVYSESYDKVILSPGALPIKPNLPGIDLDRIYHVRSIPDSDRIKMLLDTGRVQSAVVVGGGYIGLEMAENILHRGIVTIIVEMLPQVMPLLDQEMAGMIYGHLSKKGVICRLGEQVTSFAAGGDDRILVSLAGGDQLETDMVLLCVGVRPENGLAKKAGLALGSTGGIKVNAAMQTSDPDIYAVGDAVEVRDFVTGLPTITALAGPANKQGRIAAENALGRKSIFSGTLATSVVKIFDLVIAATGASEKVLSRNRIPFLASYIHAWTHANYYPGAEKIAIKLLFSPAGGKILGAQVVGRDGVDKRIDVLATAIRGTMTVFDLEELELAYAPPYSSAKDPVNIAGFVAANMLRGDMEAIQWHHIEDANGAEKTCLIDLRNQQELDDTGRIDGALHIPLDALRERLPELDMEEDYTLFCSVGLRAYIGHRILAQKGFKSRNLSGGYRTYMGAKGKEID